MFPAAPATSSFAGKFTLLAKNGFLVSSEREANETKYVGLRSQWGATARVVNLWGTQQIRVRRTSDNAVLLTSSAAEVEFATAANTTYVVRDDTHHSTTVNAAATYTFTGTGIQYLSERNGDMGTVDVYLDNTFQATVDLRATGTRQVQQVVWERSGLTRAQHTIRIVNRSTSVGMIDAYRVTP